MRTDHAGDGLGLAIIKSIAQAHDRALTPRPPCRRRAPRHGGAPRRGTARRPRPRRIDPSRRRAVAAAG
jgi:hypothetical protein